MVRKMLRSTTINAHPTTYSLPLAVSRPLLSKSTILNLHKQISPKRTHKLHQVLSIPSNPPSPRQHLLTIYNSLPGRLQETENEKILLKMKITVLRGVLARGRGK